VQEVEIIYSLFLAVNIGFSYRHYVMLTGGPGSGYAVDKESQKLCQLCHISSILQQSGTIKLLQQSGTIKLLL
jgi:hypothetical protein